MPVQRSKDDQLQITQGSLRESRYFNKIQKPPENEEVSAVPDSKIPQKAILFPTNENDRKGYMTKSNKHVTPHQWAVYDFVLTIPLGKVVTYKDIALAAGGSPRSVGNALRNNPFSPYVPCHRVIASNLFIGGFFGEWGKDHKTGTRCNQKLDMLSEEGVNFNSKGLLLNPKQSLWKSQPISSSPASRF